MKTTRCPTCGASTNEYKHGLSKPLVQGLTALASSGGGPINLKALGLTRTQWDNFQKLRYFGLVEQVAVSGKRQAGVWKITQLGLDFLAGKVVVPKFAWTFRGDVVRTEGPYITITEVKGGFQPRSVWAAQAEPADLPESDAA